MWYFYDENNNRIWTRPTNRGKTIYAGNGLFLHIVKGTIYYEQCSIKMIDWMNNHNCLNSESRNSYMDTKKRRINMTYFSGENIQEGIAEAAKLGLKLEEDPYGCIIRIPDNKKTVEFHDGCLGKTIYYIQQKTWEYYGADEYLMTHGTWEDEDYTMS